MLRPAFFVVCTALPVLALSVACSDGKPPVLNATVPTSTSTTTASDGGGTDAPLDAPPPTTFAALAGVTDLRVSAGFLWIAAPNGGGTNGSIVRVPLGGGAPEDVLTKLAEPARLALTTTDLLYTTARKSDGAGTLGQFFLGDAGGATLAPTTFAFGLGLDAQFVYASDTTTTLHVVRRVIAGGAGAVDFASTTATARGAGIVATPTEVFVAASDGIVYVTDIGGGPLGVHAGPFDGPCTDMVATTTDLYVAVDAPAPKGAIVKVPMKGTPASTLVTGLDRPTRLALEANRIYWSSATAGTLAYSALDKPGAVTFSAGLDGPGPLALDPTHVYVGTQGQVGRLAKP
jgi:hypothetical protein